MSQQESIRETIREDIRPGLTMVRRRVLKEDGRYLYYYTFERSSTGPAADGGKV